MREWSFETIAKKKYVPTAADGDEDAGGGQRVNVVKTGDKFKSATICIGISGLVLSMVSIVIGILAATGAFSGDGSSTITVVTENATTTVVITTPVSADETFVFSPGSPPPVSPPAPAVPCMPSSVVVFYNSFNYLIDGLSTGRYIGPHEYTFTDSSPHPLFGTDPSHPYKLVSGVPIGCNPTLVSATNISAAGYYSGTVVYSFSGCLPPQAVEFYAETFGRLNLGVPVMTLYPTC